MDSILSLVQALPATDSWGPTVTTDTLRDGLPYAPFSKGDKLGRMADWTAEGKDREGRGGRQQYGRNFRGEEQDMQDLDNTGTVRLTSYTYRPALRRRRRTPNRSQRRRHWRGSQLLHCRQLAHCRSSHFRPWRWYRFPWTWRCSWWCCCSARWPWWHFPARWRWQTWTTAIRQPWQCTAWRPWWPQRRLEGLGQAATHP